MKKSTSNKTTNKQHKNLQINPVQEIQTEIADKPAPRDFLSLSLILSLCLCVYLSVSLYLFVSLSLSLFLCFYLSSRFLSLSVLKSLASHSLALFHFCSISLYIWVIWGSPSLSKSHTHALSFALSKSYLYRSVSLCFSECFSLSHSLSLSLSVSFPPTLSVSLSLSHRISVLLFF